MLLALDTATVTASIALYDLAADQLLVEQTWQARRRHTQELLTVAQQLLSQVGVAIQQLSALAVTVGPGSFTGVRIALSTAKGIGLGLAAPPRVIGIPTLSVTAAPWLSLLSAHSRATICAYIQAGRGRYNWVNFGAGEQLRRPNAADHQTGSVDEFAQALAQRMPQPIWLIGELDSGLQQAVTPLAHVVTVDAVSSWRRAGALARLAALHFTAGVEDDLQTLQPLYLREP